MDGVLHTMLGTLDLILREDLILNCGVRVCLCVCVVCVFHDYIAFKEDYCERSIEHGFLGK